MDEHQPNNQEPIDPEYEAIKGKIPGLEESEEETKEEESTKQEESESEEESPVEEPEDNDEKQEDEPAPEDAAAEDKKDDTKRPEKYIPVKKYTSEKNEWRTEKETLEKEIESLRQGNKGQQEDAIKAYAEKHDVSEDSVRELAEIFGKGETTKSDQNIIDEAMQARLDRADEMEANQMYDEEFSSLALPKLKKLYPEASEAQLKSAKKELEKIATSNEFLSTPLDKIVLASQEELGSIFETKAPRKGPETGRQAPKRGNTEYTADDFKDGKTSFTKLLELPVEQQTSIVDKMDMKTYDHFSRFISRNDPVVINRGGRKIRS